jgi:hypothetical protein
MAAFALLIGTKNGKRTLLADGGPLEVRRLFKDSNGEGQDLLEVIESTTGRTRRRGFKAKEAAKPLAKKQAANA